MCVIYMSATRHRAPFDDSFRLNPNSVQRIQFINLSRRVKELFESKNSERFREISNSLIQYLLNLKMDYPIDIYADVEDITSEEVKDEIVQILKEEFGFT